MELPFIVGYTSIFSVVFPLAGGLLTWRHLKESMKLLLWVAVASVLTDGISLIMIKLRIGNWPLLNLFALLQFVLLFLLLAHKTRIGALWLLFFLCMAFSLYNYAFLQTPEIFNSYSSYACGILMIVSALGFLYHLVKDTTVANVQSLPLFWVAFGVLIYYGGTLFLFLFNNDLIAYLGPGSHQTIWILHNLLNVTKNIFFFIAIWVNYRRRTFQS